MKIQHPNTIALLNHLLRICRIAVALTTEESGHPGPLTSGTAHTATKLLVIRRLFGRLTVSDGRRAAGHLPGRGAPCPAHGRRAGHGACHRIAVSDVPHEDRVGRHARGTRPAVPDPLAAASGRGEPGGDRLHAAPHGAGLAARPAVWRRGVGHAVCLRHGGWLRRAVDRRLRRRGRELRRGGSAGAVPADARGGGRAADPRRGWPGKRL